MNIVKQISPVMGHPRIFRQVSFDIATFDALQDAKRRLSATLGHPMTNSGLLRVLLLSHPFVRAVGEETANGS